MQQLEAQVKRCLRSVGAVRARARRPPPPRSRGRPGAHAAPVPGPFACAPALCAVPSPAPGALLAAPAAPAPYGPGVIYVTAGPALGQPAVQLHVTPTAPTGRPTRPGALRRALRQARGHASEEEDAVPPGVAAPAPRRGPGRGRRMPWYQCFTGILRYFDADWAAGGDAGAAEQALRGILLLWGGHRGPALQHLEALELCDAAYDALVQMAADLRLCLSEFQRDFPEAVPRAPQATTVRELRDAVARAMRCDPESLQDLPTEQLMRSFALWAEAQRLAGAAQREHFKAAMRNAQEWLGLWQRDWCALEAAVRHALERDAVEQRLRLRRRVLMAVHEASRKSVAEQEEQERSQTLGKLRLLHAEAIGRASLRAREVRKAREILLHSVYSLSSCGRAAVAAVAAEEAVALRERRVYLQCTAHWHAATQQAIERQELRQRQSIAEDQVAGRGQLVSFGWQALGALLMGQEERGGRGVAEAAGDAAAGLRERCLQLRGAVQQHLATQQAMEGQEQRQRQMIEEDQVACRGQLVSFGWQALRMVLMGQEERGRQRVAEAAADAAVELRELQQRLGMQQAIERQEQRQRHLIAEDQVACRGQLVSFGWQALGALLMGQEERGRRGVAEAAADAAAGLRERCLQLRGAVQQHLATQQAMEGQEQRQRQMIEEDQRAGRGPLGLFCWQAFRVLLMGQEERGRQAVAEEVGKAEVQLMAHWNLQHRLSELQRSEQTRRAQFAAEEQEHWNDLQMVLSFCTQLLRQNICHETMSVGQLLSVLRFGLGMNSTKWRAAAEWAGSLIFTQQSSEFKQKWHQIQQKAPSHLTHTAADCPFAHARDCPFGHAPIPLNSSIESMGGSDDSVT